MTSSTGSRIRLRSCADLLAGVPYLLGFHPTDSIVAVALRRGVIAFAARGDLPGPALPAGAVAARFVALLVRERADAVLLIGYGAAARVTAAVDALRDALGGTRLQVVDALRVEDGRYWSYVCADPSCCPPSGTPFDATTAPAAAAAVFAGQVALADRAAVVRQIAPVTGPARMAMEAATRRAEQRLRLLLDSPAPAAPEPGGGEPGGSAREPSDSAQEPSGPAREPSGRAREPAGLPEGCSRADASESTGRRAGPSGIRDRAWSVADRGRGPANPAGGRAGSGISESPRHGVSEPEGLADGSGGGIRDLTPDRAAAAVSGNRVTSREAVGTEVGKVVSHELPALIGLGSSTRPGRRGRAHAGG
jgi:hypothetical protein